MSLEEKFLFYQTQGLENYSFRMIFISLVISLVVYLVGTVLTLLFNEYIAMFFIILIFANLLLSLKLRCSYCYYYDKWCYTGFGKLASKVFRKGPVKEFQNPKNIFPIALLSMIILLIPLVSGIIVFIFTFELVVLFVIIFYLLISLIPNFVIKRRTCKSCKQRLISCPVNRKSVNDISLEII